MATGDWAQAALCLDQDVIDQEGQALSWAGGSLATYREQAKQEIGRRLRFALRDRELVTDEPEILDLVSDYGPLLMPAVYWTLHLTAEAAVTGGGGGFFERKAVYYFERFEDELPRAIGMLHGDWDESGTIEDTEKYSVERGVTFTRGRA